MIIPIVFVYLFVFKFDPEPEPVLNIMCNLLSVEVHSAIFSMILKNNAEPETEVQNSTLCHVSVICCNFLAYHRHILL